jgi:hypothetical protein
MGAKKNHQKYLYRKVLLAVLAVGCGVGIFFAFSQSSKSQITTIAAWNKEYLSQTEHLVTPIKGILDALGAENYSSLVSSCKQLGQDATDAESWPAIPNSPAASHFSSLINSLDQVALDCQNLTEGLQKQQNPKGAINKMSSEMSVAAQQMKDVITALQAPA